MSDIPRETLIAALEGVTKGRIPEEQNLLRMFHHGYVRTREVLQRNAASLVCVRTYFLETTDTGETLLEAMS